MIFWWTIVHLFFATCIVPSLCYHSFFLLLCTVYLVSWSHVLYLLLPKVLSASRKTTSLMGYVCPLLPEFHFWVCSKYHWQTFVVYSTRAQFETLSSPDYFRVILRGDEVSMLTYTYLLRTPEEDSSGHLLSLAGLPIFQYSLPVLGVIWDALRISASISSVSCQQDGRK